MVPTPSGFHTEIGAPWDFPPQLKSLPRLANIGNSRMKSTFYKLHRLKKRLTVAVPTGKQNVNKFSISIRALQFLFATPE